MGRGRTGLPGGRYGRGLASGAELHWGKAWAGLSRRGGASLGAEPGPQGPARLFGCAALGGRLNPSADSGAGRDRGRGGAMVLCPVIGKLLQKHVVLASASPRRQEILSNAVSGLGRAWAGVCGAGI